MCRASSTYPPASNPHTVQAYSDLALCAADVDVINGGGGGNGGMLTACVSAPGSVPNTGGLSFTGSCSSLVATGRQLVFRAAAAACNSGLETTGGVHIAALMSAPVANATSDVTSADLVGFLWASDVPGTVPVVAVADFADALAFCRTRVVGDPGSNGTAPPSGMLPSGLRTYPRPWPFSSRCRLSALLNLDEKRQTEQRNRWTFVCDLR